MDAITYKALGVIEYGELPDPAKPSADEVLVRMRASGICHTDIDILHGRYGNSTFPLVPGHEYAGEIVAVGDGVTGSAVGDRVVVDPNIHCGQCRACKKGLTNLCEQLGAYGVTVNGGFAGLSAVHKDNIVDIGDLSFETAALAEPMGCVLTGVNAFDIESLDNALVFGAGPIGILLALALKARGVDDVTMVDINESRLALAETFGLGAVPAGSDRLKTFEQSVDLVADATGVSAVAESLINYAANGGNVLFFGVCPPGQTIAVSPHEVFRRQIRIAGTHSLNHNIPEALATINKIGPDIDRLVSHRVPLQDIAGFLENHGANPDSLKIQAVVN